MINIKIDNEFIERMLDYRWENRLTQKAFANMIGISRQQLWNIENGLSTFSDETYRKIVAVIGEKEE